MANQSYLRNRLIIALVITTFMIILAPKSIYAAGLKRNGSQISTPTPTSTSTPATFTCPGVLTLSSPVFNRPDGPANPPTSLTGNTNSRYRATPFTVSVSGTYILTMTFGNFTGGSADDGFYVLYSPSFTPGTPLVNALEADDDAGPGLLPQITRSLTAGTQYVIVSTTFADNVTGGFVDQFSGPGTVDFTCVGAPTNTPTPSPTFTPSNTPTPTRTFTPTATPSNTATFTLSPVPPRPDTIGVYKDGVFSLRNANNSGAPDITAPFGGDVSDLPVAGDWNGDGVDTIGIYRGSTGVYFLSDSNTTPVVSHSLVFGNPGDTPFAGKWTSGANHDGVGVYRNSNGILYQKDNLTTGFSDYFAIFGNPGDQGFGGDFNGNGFDSIGIYRSSNLTWYMTNNSQPSGITFSDIDFVWTIGTAHPVIGDWNGDTISTVGYFTSSGVFDLHSTNAAAGSDNVFPFGPTNSYPIAGKWVAASTPPVNSVFNNGYTGASNGNSENGGQGD